MRICVMYGEAVIQIEMSRDDAATYCLKDVVSWSIGALKHTVIGVDYPEVEDDDDGSEDPGSDLEQATP